MPKISELIAKLRKVDPETTNALETEMQMATLPPHTLEQLREAAHSLICGGEFKNHAAVISAISAQERLTQ